MANSINLGSPKLHCSRQLFPSPVDDIMSIYTNLPFLKKMEALEHRREAAQDFLKLTPHEKKSCLERLNNESNLDREQKNLIAQLNKLS